MPQAVTDTLSKKRFITVLHYCVLAAALWLVGYITLDTLRNVTFVTNPAYLRMQLWICVFFLVEIFVEAAMDSKPWKFLLHNAVFILVCVPYLSIIHRFNLTIGDEASYLLRFVPMVRAAAVLSRTWGLMSRNWVTSMFGAYIIMLVSTLYFLSLMFYVAEESVNPTLQSFLDALWYAVMQMTTCGSNIVPVTVTGKVIGVVLSAEGLILFPVFTVYFTHAFSRTRESNV